MSSSSLSTGSSKFSADLFAQLTKTQQLENNVVFSPMSIYMALLMTMSGADGSTLDAMKKALHIHYSSVLDLKTWRESILKPYVKDRLSLVKDGSDGMVSVANRIFLEQTSTVRDDYQKFVTDAFQVSVQLSNFKENADAERCEINQWVEKQTNGLIKELLQQNTIDNLTRIVLVNAIYFLGKWKIPFDISETKLMQPFRQVNGKQSNSATMMNMRMKDLSYGENSHVKYVKLPYENPKFSMYFVMSLNDKVVSNTSETETEKYLCENLSSTTLDLFLPVSKTKVSQLSIPKFDIEFMTSLKDILSGAPFDMKVAFSDACNLGNLTAYDVQISDVIHKAVIKVSEQGTEAAAATAVICSRKKKSTNEKPKVFDFIADRPFTFLLTMEDSILFMGKVNKL